jgi:epsilon-lactone hydrolase
MNGRHDGGSDRPAVDEDAMLHVPAFDLPASVAWSPEAQKVFLTRFTNNPVSRRARERDDLDDEATRWMAEQSAYREGMEFLHRRLVAKMRPDHPVEIEETTVGGVRVQVVTPASGVLDPSRVLVNLHGGAFVGGAEHCGLVESIPIATTGGFRVVVVDYRQGWEHRFPAASEDVAAVYAALLADHTPATVGMFGYSAGALLTAQSVAWMLAHGLPVPGVVALCSGDAGLSGDSAYLGAVAMGDVPPEGVAPTIVSSSRFGYLAGTRPEDPLVAPGDHPDVLAAFPPSLVLSGTRAFELSGSVRTHRALLAAGAASELHVWEGLWHCFPYHHRMSESQDAYRTIADFFDRYLVA